MTTETAVSEQVTEPRPPTPETAPAEATAALPPERMFADDHKGPDIEPERLDADAVRVLLRLRQHGHE